MRTGATGLCFSRQFVAGYSLCLVSLRILPPATAVSPASNLQKNEKPATMDRINAPDAPTVRFGVSPDGLE